MNNGIYRLVFNASRGLWMAVGEHVRGHQAGKTSLARSGKRRRNKAERARASLFILLLGFGAIESVSVSFAAPLLPVGTIPTNLQATQGNITINAPVINPANANGQLLNINQSTLKGILQGSNFNIGGASAVNFNHTGGAGSATLVRINGLKKSVIEGALNSPNGAIYLINQNGILFANGATVNVNGLVASALNLTDGDFLSDRGHLQAAFEAQGRAAYIWGGNAAGFKEVVVQVEPDAKIKAALGSSVMLFAPTVINQGSIETVEGQVAMAAGEKVYLSYAPDLNANKTTTEIYSYTKDSPYRGLAGVLVEVDSYQKKSTDAADDPDELMGQVTNDTMGRILAQRNNVTLAGFMVNQNGRVTATSSASQKGSIRLLARDTKTTGDAVIEGSNGTVGNVANQSAERNTLIAGSRTGKLTVGKDSITTVLAEDSAALIKAKEIFATPQVGEPVARAGEQSYVEKVLSAVNVKGSTLTDSQVFNAPTIEAMGHQVVIGDNAKIVAPGGFINISAQKDGALLNPLLTDAESKLYLGKNTLIDVAGLQNVSVAMERNFVESLLTYLDLKDDPINRDGFLYRQKIWFDIRNVPDSRVADLAGFVKQVPRSLGEKLANAGTVTLKSEGDFVQAAGSKVDVSGGSLKFETGVHKETQLMAANGKTYAIGDAPVDTLFTGFVGGTNTLLRQESGYVEGKSAGTVKIDAVNMALDGQLSGGAIYGERQRDSANLGGKLAINVMDATGNLGHDVTINNHAPLSASFTANDTLPAEKIATVEIDGGMLNRSGFEDINLNTTGNLKVNTALNLVDGTKIALSGADVEVNSNIVAHGGSVSLKSQFSEGATAPANITVANGVKLDVSGNWTNDVNAATTGRVTTKGGQVALSSAEQVTLGTGSLVDVSGGGWLRRDKKLVNGNAGSINIEGQVGQDGNVRPFTYTAPTLNGELRGFALGTGGNLSITAPFITVGNSGFGDAREFLANPAFFQNSGFTGFNLTGRDGVIVRSNTNVDVIAKNYLLNNNYSLKATGERLHDFATTTVLPSEKRSSTSLALNTQSALDAVVPNAFAASGVARGSVVVETGAVVKVDSNGVRKDADGHSVPPSIALSAWDNQVYVDGTLQALGGDIALTMNGDATGITDNGYNAAQAIWLGEHAKLLAGGYTQLNPTTNGLRVGTVYDGGSVTLDAKKGYVVAQAGSVVDVAGTSAVLDVKNVNRYTATTVASNAGDVLVSAREGVLLDSTFKASSLGALGGSFTLRVTRGDSKQSGNVSAAPYPGTAADFSSAGNAPDQLWYIDVSQAGGFVPTNLQMGDSIQPSAGGVAKIAADTISNAGFSDVALKSEYGVRFTGDVDLKTNRSISVNANVIEATADSKVKLTAPNVVLGNVVETKALRDSSSYGSVTPVAGTANLVVNSNLLDIKGNIALSGFASSSLNSTGDIRLSGISNPQTIDNVINAPAGQLLSTGVLSFNARQVFPTSLSDFTVTALGAGSKISFNGTGSHDSVLSAGGKLTVNAETIDQNGVLLAPFGTINLNASDTLNLGATSLTSVSAQGALIPFGYTARDGLDYLYDFGPGTQQFKATADASAGVAPPERVVKFSAPNINQAAGSQVDISGGGDLFAYEWVPGIGGSADVLASNANQNAFGQGTTATWAIMPASNATFASYDTQYWQGSDIEAGDAVYISGVAGLAAGYYTLLPARYALLPGAMLVSAVTGYQDRPEGQAQKLANGSTLISGHLAAYTANGYTQTSRTAGFVVRPGSDAYKLAQYNTTTASTYFKGNTQAQQTADAGRLSFAATNSLVLKGILNALPGQGGKGAEVDVAAPRLLVVNTGEATGQVSIDGENYLAIDESTLANFNAASLMLGGTRDNGKANIISTEVRMANNADLAGSEVILAATDKVRLDAGATLKGAGTAASNRDLEIGDASNNVDGDGALLRVSGGKLAQITRQNSDGSSGDLIIESDATVEGAGSLLLDSSKSTVIAGNLKYTNGAELGFASSRISVGAPANNEALSNGLWLQKTQLDQFANASSVLLKSNSTIDVYGETGFGNKNVDLTLQSAGVAGYQNDGKTATITARNLTVSNNDAVAFTEAPALANGTTPALGAGSLNMNASTLTSGGNTVRLAGFNQVNINASKEVIVDGNTAQSGVGILPSKLVADTHLAINAPRITAKNKADATIEATNGLLKVQGIAGAQPTLTAASSQGSKLKLRGDQVLLAGGSTQASNTTDVHGAVIDMQSGDVAITATGLDAADHVTMQNGARILAQGSSYKLNNQVVDLPAGKVTLTSEHGNVEVEQGALVDLTASGTGDAGQFVASAVNGQANIAGLIKAAEAGLKGNNAQASVDAMVINNMSQTIAALSTFSGTQSYRVREGDITVANHDAITANHVIVVADNGSINVNGKIDASGDKGGSIEVIAKNDVTINNGAQLLAKGNAQKTSTAGSTGNGGSVLISSEAGTITVAAPNADGSSGALIDVSGVQTGAINGQGGEVIFKAARTGTGVGDGVKVDSQVAAAVTGAERILVEAVKKYNYTNVNTAVQNTIVDDTNAFASNVASVMATYSKTRDGKTAIIAPSVEINSAGDLTVSNDWSIGNTMPSGGVLTLRAEGDLKINGNLSQEPYVTGTGNTISQIPNSWSYRLVAGADNSAVNTEAVNIGAGNIVVKDAKLVRTGTGFIHAVAGNNIQLGTENGAGAAIYSEGLPEAVVTSGIMDNPTDFKLLATNFGLNRELYANAGGNVSLNAGGDITGSEAKANNQTVNEWLYHAALAANTKNQQVRWWSRYDKFTNGVATLGGGDVNIKAGGNVSNLQIAAATNGRMGGDINAAPDMANFVELGGGDINVSTKGSINQTLIHAGHGSINAQADGDLNTSLSLMNSKVALQASGDVNVAGVSNPTVNNNSRLSNNLTQIKFYSYDEQTGVKAFSIAGDATITGSEVLPSSLYMAAPNGDVTVKTAVLMPSKDGNVTLLAGHDVAINSLIMSEVDPKNITGIATPDIQKANDQEVTTNYLSFYVGATSHTDGLLHAANTNPVRVYAGHDVVFKTDENQIGLPLVTPKRTEVIAGHDVVNPNMIVQNLHSTDVSIVQAGNDIRYTDPLRVGDQLNAIDAGIVVAGPGRLHIVANGDVDLGASNGIKSIGNSYNPYLPEQGADVMVQPGAAAVANYNGILAAYVDPASLYSSIYLPQLIAYMQTQTGSVPSASQALADFKAMDKQAQTAFINQVFFAELKAGGADANNAKGQSFGDYSRSERAILTMFPEFTTDPTLVSQAGSIMKAFENISNEPVTHPGNLNLFYSQIRSERGGKIELLVPGGLVNAGLAVAGGPVKPDTDLGIVSLRGGELLGFVRKDFQVNQSRVFTLGGSDLMLYSALNDIDAGKGAKTSSSTPPPEVRIVNGQVVYDYSGSVAGSGIAALTSTGGKPGDVYLYAPYGEINAGEAGIRSEGNINLGARVVTGADNIVAGGVTTGAPAASVSGLSVSAPASSNAGNNTKAGEQAGDGAKQAPSNKLASLPSLISVEVLSLGDESSATSEQCKNQKDNKACQN
jgi:filamentous hemagglutinin family protein